MGAHLSTVQAKVSEEFKKHDEGCKGYLVLKEVMSIKTTYGISPCHLGVLHKIDKDHDAHFMLEELLEFASWAHQQYRSHRGADASYMVAGACSLGMWGAIRHQREQFVEWVLKLFTKGFEVTQFAAPPHCLLVHRKAIKALHVLFDMERNQGVDYQTLQGMMQYAAAEQQQLDLRNDHHKDWVPVGVMRTFLEAITEGMDNLMEPFFADDTELDDVLMGIERTGTGRGSTCWGGDAGGSSRGPSLAGGGLGLPLMPRQKLVHRM